MFLFKLLSLFFSFSLLYSGFMVIYSKNPVHSVFFLVSLFLNTIALFLLFRLHFLSFIFLIIYVGAIAVLFLFVVMMLNIRILELKRVFLRFLPIGFCSCFLFFSEIFFSLFLKFDLFFNIDFFDIINSYDNWLLFFNSFSTFFFFSDVLFIHYFFYFIVAGFILLVAMLGSIVLTLKNNSITRSQKVSYQLIRNSFINYFSLIK